MQKSPEAEPIMTPLCKGGSKTPAFEPHVTPGFARLNPGILRKGQLNRHTRYRPATTTRNTATQRSCHSGILRKGLLNRHTKKLTRKPKKGGAVRAGTRTGGPRCRVSANQSLASSPPRRRSHAGSPSTLL